MCLCMPDVARIPASASSTGAIPGASRVALRAWEECVEGDKAREPDGALLPGRASPAIVQMKTLASTV